MKLFNDIRDKILTGLKTDLGFERGGGRREPKYVSRVFPGKTWNPVRKYPRNHGCFCGSGVKAKKCCLPHLALVVSEKFASHIKENWSDILTGHMTLPKSPKAQ